MIWHYAMGYLAFIAWLAFWGFGTYYIGKWIKIRRAKKRLKLA